MTSRDLAGCCGIRVIYDFGSTRHSDFSEDVPLDIIEEQLKSVEEWCRNSMFLVALNDEQYIKFNDLLVEKGYKVVEKGFHPAHRSIIYVYIKLNTKFSHDKIAEIEKAMEVKKIEKEIEECIQS